jgi:uncharacterized protein YcaQ
MTEPWNKQSGHRAKIISLASARRVALHTQLLDGRASLPNGKEGVAQTIERLGYVQIDTIAVIRRAHHHTLWTRRPDYAPEMLHELQARDRRVFEYWGHAASYLPMSEYRYYLPRMRSFGAPRGKWERDRLERCGHLMEPVLERIREEGPLTSKDFAPPPGTKRGQWWDWKPAKVALELLFGKGDLMITERRNFQRVYDLTERVLSTDVDTSVPDEDELGRFLVRRALAAYGVAQEREIRDHIHAAERETISKSLADLVDAGQVIPVEIEGTEGAQDYALPEVLEKSAQIDQHPGRVVLLSPFDNLIIQRARMRRLFGYDYSLECYQPAAKRQYGYFVLPILWSEQLVGRLDPKADRKRKTLIVRGLFFEPEFADFDAFLPVLAQRLSDFARFNQCESVELEYVFSSKVKAMLEQLLSESFLHE